MRKSNFTLRLPLTLLQEARKGASAEGVTLNELVNVAVAEKLSAIRTAAFIASQTKWADVNVAKEILARARDGRSPVLGSELPPRFKVPRKRVHPLR